jgi:hypothetical protein
VTREQRLRAAVESSWERLLAASSDHDDEQAMFQALGECLTWLCALEELFWLRGGYENARDGDSQGRVLPGLRRARDAIVHGDPAVDVANVADSSTVPMPTIVRAVHWQTPQVILPPTRIAWVFKPTLPPPPKTTKHTAKQENAYAAFAGLEVIAPVQDGVQWLDRVISGRT